MRFIILILTLSGCVTTRPLLNETTYYEPCLTESLKVCEKESFTYNELVNCNVAVLQLCRIDY